MEATDRTLGELIKTMRKAEGVTKGELAIAVYSSLHAGKMEKTYHGLNSWRLLGRWATWWILK